MTLPPTLAANPALDTWIRLEPDEMVTLFTGKAELGQGLVAAIARIGAEELDLSPARISVATADTNHQLDERLTAGSQSLSESGMALRQACAEARAHLLALAAKRLGVAIDRLSVQDGHIAGPQGASTTYWELLTDGRFGREATGDVTPKRPHEQRLVGRPGDRPDVVGLVTGTTRFVADLDAPGLLHARVVRPPNQLAQLDDVDVSRAETMAGIVCVVRDGDFLAVVAAREEQAARARSVLEASARWLEDDVALPDQTTLPAWLVEQPRHSFPVVEGVATEGPTDPPTQAADDVTRWEASFSRPFVMHGSIGPSAALALWDAGALHVRSHTQGAFFLRATLADALDLDIDAVRVEHVVGPGCYGHNGADDAALDAALAARALPGRPVLLKWTRQDEHGWEPYGAPAVVQLTADLDSRGNLAGWSTDVIGLTHNSRPVPSPDGSGLLAAWSITRARPRPPNRPWLAREAGIHRNATPAYRIPRTRIVKHLVDARPLRTSALRALGAYVNVFAIETAMDELAGLAERDPLEFRLAHLDDPRARAVLEAAAQRAGWDARHDDDRALGLAFGRYKNQAGYTAVVVELTVDDATATVTLVRATIAADVGQIVDPMGLTNQLEGGFVQSASWTLHERVSFDRTRVTSLDWDSYPMLRFSEVPELDTVLVDRPGEPFLGAGEITQGPTAAAIGNAIYAGTGIRARDLPFTPERLRRAAGA